jgi:phosphate starvation-inducible membrane PsiE
MTRRFGHEDDTAGTSAAAPRATGGAPGGGGRPDVADAKASVDRFGNILVDAFQLVALFVIGGTIVWSAAHEYLHMIRAGIARPDDILLLFIYLELGTMVGIYFKTDRLPVLFLLYVAITALTRFLAVDVQDLPMERVLVVTGSILVLALAALVLQLMMSRRLAAGEGRSDGFKVTAKRDGT